MQQRVHKGKAELQRQKSQLFWRFPRTCVGPAMFGRWGPLRQCRRVLYTVGPSESCAFPPAFPLQETFDCPPSSVPSFTATLQIPLLVSDLGRDLFACWEAQKIIFRSCFPVCGTTCFLIG